MALNDEIVRVTVQGRDRVAVLKLMSKYDVDTSCMPARTTEDGRFESEGLASRKNAEALAADAARPTSSVEVTIHENIRTTFARRLGMVGDATRLRGRWRVRGLGTKE
jgi:hypothetical protein